jgi:hypothetical protein
MKLKVSDDGVPAVIEGKPVYVTDDGKEIAFDAPGTVETIRRLNGEAKNHRERAEKAERDLKAFEGITDPGAAVKALNTLRSLDEKQLIDAGKAEEVKAAAIKTVEERYKPIVEERDVLMRQLHSEIIGGSFARSKYIADKIAVPADILQAAFGSRFSVESGKMVARDVHGNQIYSPSRAGEPASFDEALEILVEAYPSKAAILKGSGAEGGGSRGSSTGQTGPKTLTRKQFEALAPGEQITKMREGFKVVDA